MLFDIVTAVLLWSSNGVVATPQHHVNLFNQPFGGKLPTKSLAKVTIGSFGFDEDGQEKSVLAGDDFFTYANGKYIETLEIPEDQSQWGPFSVLAEESRQRVRGILEKDAKVDGKMGKFYTSYMNKDLADELDIKPIKPMLAEVKSMQNGADFAKLSGRGSSSFFASPFSIGIGPDAKDASSYCVTLGQGGLGMPRDYYLKDLHADKRSKYADYAMQLLDMVDWPHAERASKDVLALEQQIAKASWSEAELRDPIKTYNPVANATDLHDKAPGFDWAALLMEAGGLPGNAKLIVSALSGVAGIAKIVNTTDIGILRSWSAFHLVAAVAPALSERFVNASFAFMKVMTGQKKLASRWKRAVESLNVHMGDAIGQVFVQQFFPASAKQKVEALTQELKKAFGNRLQKSDWMTDATKRKALTKLDSFSIEVGYPSKFRDYDGLVVKGHDLLGNIRRSYSFDWNYSLGKLGKPVDRKEWAMNPQTVNAYNMLEFNQVVFPAAILQPPFFDPEADMAINYGGIGAVIGHEMTHGFDDAGRKYNAKGQLEDWWTKDDAKEFSRRAGAYDEQFVGFDLKVPEAHIKRNLTTGEDIADLGGLTLALDAYKSYRAAKDTAVSFLAAAAQRRSVDQQEGIRRVFLGWAQVWRTKQRPDALLRALSADPHPPSRARVDIPCRNMPAWYDAFGVQKGQKNYLSEEERVVLW